MKKTTTLLILAVLVAAPLTGCIENMDDLKDRLSAASSDENQDDTLDNVPTNGTADATGNTTNTTQREFKPPVARVTVYAPGGALLYRASFVAEDQIEPVMGDKGTYSLLAAESEALDSTARLEKFEWDVNGETFEGRKADVNISTPGINMITLTVTDSNGKTDSQMVHVGVLPDPFDVVSTFEGGEQAGTWGYAGDQQYPTLQTHEITVEETVDGKAVTPLKLQVVVGGFSPTTAYTEITLLDAEGNEVASGDDTIVVDGPAAGTYTLEVRLDGATEGYTGEVTVTYREVIEGLGGDGHGGHAH